MSFSNSVIPECHDYSKWMWTGCQTNLDDPSKYKGIGEYGDFAFRSDDALLTIDYSKTRRPAFKLHHEEKLPIQTLSFLDDLPHEIRRMIYEYIISPVKNSSNLTTVQLSTIPSGLIPQQWNSTRRLYSLQIRDPMYNPDAPQPQTSSVPASVLSSLRNLSNTCHQIRYELGFYFYHKVALRIPTSGTQGHINHFFQNRPAITHIKLLDLGRWRPMWRISLTGDGLFCPFFDTALEKESSVKLRLLSDLLSIQRKGVKFDVIKLELYGFVLRPGFASSSSSCEFKDSDIVELLSTYDHSSADNFSANLIMSQYDWINSFRRVSLRLGSRLDLKVCEGKLLEDEENYDVGEDIWINKRRLAAPSPSRIQYRSRLFGTSRISTPIVVGGHWVQVVTRGERPHFAWVNTQQKEVRCPLVQWHLNPWKRPTFMSIFADMERDDTGVEEGEILGNSKWGLGENGCRWLPAKRGRDLGYWNWGLGMKGCRW